MVRIFCDRCEAVIEGDDVKQFSMTSAPLSSYPPTREGQMSYFQFCKKCRHAVYAAAMATIYKPPKKKGK